MPKRSIFKPQRCSPGGGSRDLTKFTACWSAMHSHTSAKVAPVSGAPVGWFKHWWKNVYHHVNWYTIFCPQYEWTYILCETAHWHSSFLNFQTNKEQHWREALRLLPQHVGELASQSLDYQLGTLKNNIIFLVGFFQISSYRIWSKFTKVTLIPIWTPEFSWVPYSITGQKNKFIDAQCPVHAFGVGHRYD